MSLKPNSDCAISEVWLNVFLSPRRMIELRHVEAVAGNKVFNLGRSEFELEMNLFSKFSLNRSAGFSFDNVHTGRRDVKTFLMFVGKFIMKPSCVHETIPPSPFSLHQNNILKLV
jgi:hypothetical protein